MSALKAPRPVGTGARSAPHRRTTSVPSRRRHAAGWTRSEEVAARAQERPRLLLEAEPVGARRKRLSASSRRLRSSLQRRGFRRDCEPEALGFHAEVTLQEHARDPDGNAASSRPRPVCSRRRLSCPPTCDARSSPTQGGRAGAAQARRDTPRHTSAAALNRKDLGGGTPRKHADRQTACGKFRPAPSGEAHSSTPALGFYSLALPSLPGPCRGRVPRHQRAPTFGPEGAREAPKSHGPQIRGRCSSPPPRSAFRSPSRGIQGKWRRQSSRLPVTSAQVLPAHVSGTEGRARFTFSSLSRRRATKALRTYSFLLQTLLPRGRRARKGSGARGAHQGEGRGGRQTLFCLQRFAF